jgi:four helix bundle protein
MKPLNKFLENFDFNNPDWSELPENFPNLDSASLTGEQISKFNAIKTLWELARPQKISQQTRNWNDPKGYQYLALWQNAALLRLLVRKFTMSLPKSEHRLKAQLDDAARSFKRNIEEGWKRPTTSEYLQFLGYSQASLEEVKGDIRDARSDGFLREIKGSSLKGIGIDLTVLKGPSKDLVKGEPDDPEHPYSQPLKTLRPEDLTYEIFLELINKSDWLARKTVQSLEQKLIKDKKFYEVEQAKIRSNLRFH